MQSSLPSIKLFCSAFVAAVFVSVFSALAVAQVYQVQPGGLLIYPRRYVNPNFQQRIVAPQIYPEQIYPGQIINGERVVGPSVPAAPLSRGEAVNPPQPPVSNSDQKNQEPVQGSQQTQRPDKIPETKFPIPTGPALESEPAAESAPAATETLPTETPPNSKSSVATKEKSDPPQQEMAAVDPPTLQLPAEEPPSQPELSETPSSNALSLDELSSEGAPSDELPTVEPPPLETPEDDLLLAPPEVDEDMMAEIKQIRDQLGGGISKTLEGIDQMPSFGSIEITPSNAEAGTTDQETSPEQLFNEELRSVISEQASDGGSDIQPPQTSRTAGSLSQAQPAYGDRTEELRTCARELEQLAGRLETIQAYEQADQLRQQAAQLWTAARKQ